MRLLFFTVAVAVVLFLTLTPQPAALEGGQALRGPAGERGVADALANILLFLPVGLGAALVFQRRRTPVLLGAALSAAIELTQFAIPGRFPSPWDVLFNATGAALGVLLANRGIGLLFPAPARRARLAGSGLAAALVVLVGGSALFAPVGLHTPLVVEWAPATRHGDVYGGRIVAATLGSRHLMPGPVAFAGAPAHSLIAGDTLEVRFISGPEPPAAVPLFRISFDDRESALGLGVSGHDVVFIFRTRAAALHLDQPHLRLADALGGVRPGTPVQVSVWAHASGLCLRVGSRQACATPSAADTWSLLLYPAPWGFAAALSHIWVGLLLVPVGFWVGRAGYAAAVAVLVAALLALTPLFGLPPVPAARLLAVPLGLAAGHVLDCAARRRTAVRWNT